MITPASRILAALLCCAAASSTSRAEVRASASSGSGDVDARFAVDGNRGTRWSTDFSDSHWLLVDYGEPKDMVGVKLLWENAYASAYTVSLSADGVSWSNAFETTTGDGGLDDVDFERTTARYLKISCNRRGTAWGYSLFEVIPRTASEPWGQGEPGGFFLLNLRDAGPQSCMTNRVFIPDSWTANDPFLQLVDEDPGTTISVNGAIVTNHGTAPETWHAPIGSMLSFGHWNRISLCRRAPGRDALLIAGGAQELRDGLRELRRRDSKEYFRVLARTAPAGTFLAWLSGRQGFWTVAGEDGDFKESLLGEDGSIEPYKCFSITPFVHQGGRLLTRADAALTPSLRHGYLPLPRVHWRGRGFTLDVEALAAGPAGSSTTYVRYRIRNTGAERTQGKLYLAARPFEINPPWQWGGFTRIHDIRHATNVAQVNEFRLVPLTPPSGFGAATADEGDITGFLAADSLPGRTSLHDDEGLASAAFGFAYDLEPGAEHSVVLAIPLHESSIVDTNSGFDALAEGTALKWKRRLGRVRFLVPDPRYSDTARATLAYLLVNRDGPAIQAGSRSYEAAWMRDGAMSSAALLRMGFTNEVRDFLDWYAGRLFDDGRVPAIVIIGRNEVNPVHEYDSQGQFAHVFLQYYRFTNDRAFLDRHWPAILKALRYLAALRTQEAIEERKSDPDQRRYYGILPKCVSHEGYYPEPGNHSYWDNFWALRGWKDGRTIAELLGHGAEAEWMKAEEGVLRDTLTASLAATMEHYKLAYVPGCAELGDFDPTSSSIALTTCDEPGLVPSNAWTATFDRYWRDVESRFSPDWRGSFSPYELRNVRALIQLGEPDRALKLLDYLLDCQRPAGWRQWPEAVYVPVDHPGYIGDMPHTWAASGFLDALRYLFMAERESDSALVLANAIPAAWLESGRTVGLLQAPTYWGDLTFTMVQTGGVLHVRADGGARPPGGFVFRAPPGTPAGTATLNGQPAESDSDGAYRWNDLPADLRIVPKQVYTDRP